MSWNANRTMAYFRHRMMARNAHALHSPYLFQLYNEVIKDREERRTEDIERLRRNLMRDHRKIEVEQRTSRNHEALELKERRVCDVARRSSVPAKYGRLLMRLAEYTDADRVLELGTSIGLGTTYLARGSSGTVTTVDSCASSLEVAKEGLKKTGLSDRVLVRHGKFDELLPSLMKVGEEWGIVVMDGEHNPNEVHDYFNQILPHLHKNSVVIIDDIYRSQSMTAAWDELCRRPEVRQSIDLFRFGLLFFRTQQLREHFRLRL